MLGMILPWVLNSLKGAALDAFSKRAVKAQFGGLGGIVVTAVPTIYDAFVSGLAAGALPQVEQLGLIVGQIVAGYLVGYLITWISPANGVKKVV